MEQFESFHLADSILQKPVPPAATQFMDACVKGMSRAALLRIARERGLHIDWLPHEPRTPGAYRLHLKIDDRTVPLTVRMKTVREAQADAIRHAMRRVASHGSL